MSGLSFQQPFTDTARLAIDDLAQLAVNDYVKVREIAPPGLVHSACLLRALFPDPSCACCSMPWRDLCAIVLLRFAAKRCVR